MALATNDSSRFLDSGHSPSALISGLPRISSTLLILLFYLFPNGRACRVGRAGRWPWLVAWRPAVAHISSTLRTCRRGFPLIGLFMITAVICPSLSLSPWIPTPSKRQQVKWFVVGLAVLSSPWGLCSSLLPGRFFRGEHVGWSAWLLRVERLPRGVPAVDHVFHPALSPVGH